MHIKIHTIHKFKGYFHFITLDYFYNLYKSIAKKLLERIPDSGCQLRHFKGPNMDSSAIDSSDVHTMLECRH